MENRKIEKKFESSSLRDFDRSLIVVIFPIVVLISKLIRWTVLKESLVNMSIGHGMIRKVVSGTEGFVSWADGGISDAAGNAAVFFRYINFFNLTTLNEFEVYISIIWNIILIIMCLKMKEKLTQRQFVFVMTSVAVLNIWDFCLAKEPMQFVFFLAIYLILKTNNLGKYGKFGLSLLVLLVSVLYYRVYYILIALFYVVVTFIGISWLGNIKKISGKHVIGLLVLLVFMYFCILNGMKILDGETYQTLIDVRTRDGAANTQITNIFKTEFLPLFCLDYLLIIVRMLVPVELMRLGVKYWPYVFYQIIITFYLVQNIMKINKLNSGRLLALYLYIAFILGSAAFEPDFGSWVRHEAACYPVFMLMADVIEEKRKGSLMYEKNSNSTIKKYNPNFDENTEISDDDLEANNEYDNENENDKNPFSNEIKEKALVGEESK